MHCCEFCLSEFHARPQVKNPRACQSLDCQLQRQRLNEREWRERHSELGGSQYHAVRREQRSQRILALSVIIRKCLQVGVDLLGVAIGVGEFSEILERLLLDLGVRRINKFWNFENHAVSNDLALAINEGFVQTS